MRFGIKEEVLIKEEITEMSTAMIDCGLHLHGLLSDVT